MRSAPRSMRALLLGGSMAVLLAVLGAAAWIGFEGAQDEADELFDARLATSARVLAAQLGAVPPDPRAAPVVVPFPAPLGNASHDEAGPLGHPYETKIAFQVLDAEGRLLMRSAAAPATPFAALAPGFSTQAAAWRVFSLRAGDFWVQAAESLEVRDELSLKLALAAVTPLMAGIPLLLVLLAALMGYGLAPLAELARRIARREPGSLAPLALARTTAEIEPVLQALNGLLERVQAAIARERRFTADAAHELRTPLAALKVHAQNAARAASDAERQASLERMMAGLERSVRLVEQMLDLSRATAARAPAAPVSLQQVVEDALDDVLPKLKERRIKVSVASDPPPAEPAVLGDRDKLTSLARNLLDNAARYAPAGSAVRLEIASRPGAVVLSVSDQGPGVAPELRERVFESYYRIPGTPGDGSGLGLAIVREIASAHGAAVTLGAGEGGRGTRVSVTFPAG